VRRPEADLLIWRRSLLISGSIVSALVLAEFLLRVFLPQALGWNTALIWEPAEGAGWRRKPNLDVEVNTGERTARVFSDERGHRIGAARIAHPDVAILAIGDSFVEALQVNAEQTMTALLAESLSRQSGRTVAVVNAGVGGWDANRYLIAARRELESARYDLVLIFVFLENDLVSRRVDSFPAATNLTVPDVPRGATLEAKLSRLGLIADVFLMRHSHLYVYGRNLRELQRMRSGARHYHLLTSIMRTEEDSPDWQVTGDVLADIATRAAQQQTDVLYVLIPPHQYLDAKALASYAGAMGVSVSDVDVGQPARLLTAQLSKKGLKVVDATVALKRAFDDGQKDLYGRIDRHFAPAGHRVMASFLEPIVIASLASRLQHQ